MNHVHRELFYAGRYCDLGYGLVYVSRPFIGVYVDVPLRAALKEIKVISPISLLCLHLF